jgi:integrase/recombinase XerD
MVYNFEMREKYMNRSAVRRLDFLRRMLEFSYVTYFYKTPLAPWIEKPSVSKGHYTDKKKDGSYLSKERFIKVG